MLWIVPATWGGGGEFLSEKENAWYRISAVSVVDVLFETNQYKVHKIAGDGWGENEMPNA